MQLDGNEITSGKAVVINARKLTTGTALDISGNTNLTSGNLIHVSTESSTAEKAIVFEANDLVNGTLMSIETDTLSDGNALQIMGGNGSMNRGSLLSVLTRVK